MGMGAATYMLKGGGGERGIDGACGMPRRMFVRCVGKGVAGVVDINVVRHGYTWVEKVGGGGKAEEEVEV